MKGRINRRLIWCIWQIVALFFCRMLFAFPCLAFGNLLCCATYSFLCCVHNLCDDIRLLISLLLLPCWFCCDQIVLFDSVWLKQLLYKINSSSMSALSHSLNVDSVIIGSIMFFSAFLSVITGLSHPVHTSIHRHYCVYRCSIRV